MQPDDFVWTEGSIGRLVARELLNRKYLVIVPNCIWTGYEADLLAVTDDLRLIDIEIKISRADLKADAAKDKWWRHTVKWDEALRRSSTTTTPREWPSRCWKHYYVMPEEIWRDDMLAGLQPKCGVMLLRWEERRGNAAVPTYRLVRKATPNRDAEKISTEQAIDVARLANLRMWDALDERDGAQRALRRAERRLAGMPVAVDAAA